jgi:RNA polymerase sigma-70 factor (ECF subfamily)
VEAKRVTTPAFLETQVIIQRARDGNPGAWEELFRRYRALLTVMVHVRIPALYRGRFDTEDVLQSAFLSAFRSLGSYDYRGEASFRSWLKEITRNELADRIRAHDASKRSSGREQQVSDPDIYPRAGEEGETPSQIVSRAQRRAQVLAAMRRLEDEQQEVLWMRDFEGRTWEQIGRLSGCTESGARRRYRTALEALVRILRTQGFV